MAFDGNGNYVVPPGTQGVPGAVISSASYNALLADLQTSLSKAWLRDGQSALLSNLSLGGYKFTNAADGTADSDLATVKQLAAAEKVVTSVAQLRLQPKTGPSCIQTKNYYASGIRGGSGLYEVDVADITSIDNSGDVIVAADGGRWKLIHNGELYFEQFGAKGDDSTVNDAAFTSWFTRVLATGAVAKVGAGNFKFASPVVMDYISKGHFGFLMQGAGVQKTVFKSNITTLGASAFSLICSGGTLPGSLPGPAIGVYAKIEHIGFLSNFAGTTLMIGKRDYSDQQNLVRLEIWSSNSSDSPFACATEFNSCYGCNVGLNGGLGTVAAQGVNVRIRQTSFSAFFISIGTTATAGGLLSGTGTGLQFEGGFSYGNVFTAPDLEVCYTCVDIRSASAQDNVFLGGTYALFGPLAVAAFAGSNNLFLGGNINPGPNNGKFLGSGSTGIGVYRFVSPNKMQIAAPTAGSTVVCGDDVQTLKLTIGAAIASCTITLPTNPNDSGRVRIHTTAGILALTVNAAGSSNSVFDNTSALPGPGVCEYQYQASSATWFRIL
jgi:hypothetical protein